MIQIHDGIKHRTRFCARVILFDLIINKLMGYLRLMHRFFVVLKMVLRSI
jgi:hypothetical protein